MNEPTGVPIVQHPLLAIVAGAVFGLLAGISLALTADALPDTAISEISEIGPFSAPAERCSFNTFETTAANVPATVSRCDYLFDERQYIAVGYRI